MGRTLDAKAAEVVARFDASFARVFMDSGALARDAPENVALEDCIGNWSARRDEIASFVVLVGGNDWRWRRGNAQISAVDGCDLEQ